MSIIPLQQSNMNIPPSPTPHSGIPAPISKLPRLFSSPAKAIITGQKDYGVVGKPALMQSDLEGIENAGSRKRKGPEEEGPIANKRPASETHVAKPSVLNRGNSGGSFVPTSRTAPSATTTTRRPLASSTTSSRPASALARRTPLNASTSASALSRTRPASAATLSSTSASTGRPTVAVRRAGSSSTTATARTTLGRSTLASSTSTRPSGSANLAQTQNMQSQTGRIDQVESVLKSMQEMMQVEREKVSQLHSSQADLQNLLSSAQTTEREARRNLSTAGEEIVALREKHRAEMDELEHRLNKRERENRDLQDDLKGARSDLESARGEVRDVKAALNAQAMAQITMTTEVATLREQNRVLQSQLEEQTGRMNEMQVEVEMAAGRVKEVEEDLRAAETIRRKLHNQVQELKGNIRVFARVRPAISSERETAESLAEMEFAQKGQLTSSGQQELSIVKTRDSAIGGARKEVVPFSFDKVFQPNDGQHEVFEEISMLAQSVLDGYNVCIFAYGQTGSGKSWTMEGGKTPETAGMIPRAIQMIFAETEALKDRGWKYQMFGQFVEIYNEKINNLFALGIDNSEHKIEHDEKKGATTVTGISPIRLESPDQVHSLLARASNLRSVAATNMNERSSRSHSVFSLKIKGENPLTGESCEGVLNLVDLAGSERLDKAGTGDHKDRMKETININKSLSSLQNVIQKLSEKSSNEKAHVGYRDSTLTNLLMYSLSGRSKTLMFCNLSPMAAHTNETLNSLRFATQVNSTVVGTARRQNRTS